MGLIQAILRKENPYCNTMETVRGNHPRRAFLGTVFEGLDAIISLTALAAFPAAALGDEREVDEIEYFKEKKYDELIEYYTQQIGKLKPLTKPDPDRGDSMYYIGEVDKLYCKRAVAKAFKSITNESNKEEHMRGAMDDLLKTSFSSKPGEHLYEQWAICEILRVFDYLCFRDSDYKIPYRDMVIIKNVTNMPDSEFTPNGSYLRDWMNDIGVVYTLANDSFIRTFVNLSYDETVPFTPDSHVKGVTQERLMR